MHITDVQTTLHDAKRVSLFVDGKFALACHALVWLASGCHVGDEITEATLAQLGESEAVNALKERAIGLLAGRPRGRAELRQKLMHGTKAHPAPPGDRVAVVLDQLAEAGLIDDQAFATYWVEQRDRFRPKGAMALRAELRGKGVARDDIEAAVEPDRDLERAIAAGQRKAQSLANRPGIDARQFRDLLGPFLLRRGFTNAIAREAVAALWRDNAVAANDDMGEALSEIDE